MNTAPEISVIMSVYNGEAYLEEAIESVCRQTFKNWELIIINDCSTDKTAEILSGYALKDSRIKVHTNEINLKLPTSLNKAVSMAKGKYIARMDADDICLPERLEKQYKFMEDNKDVSLSSCRFMTLKNGVVSSGGCGGRCDNESVRALLFVTNPILHPGVIAKAESMKNLKYDQSLTCTEDLEMWVRFAKNNLKMEIMSEYLMIYRLHDKQITGTTLERQHKEVLKIEKDYFSQFSNGLCKEYEEFYINGIYFRDNADVKSFCDFYKWLRKENKKTKFFRRNALNYAMFEILAEYKRNGLSKKDLVKAMLCFNLPFLIKEFIRRKKIGRRDGMKCIEAARKIGLKQSGGTTEFPVFSEC